METITSKDNPLVKRLRALATEGIQRGHMRRHAPRLAWTAGARGPEIEAVAAEPRLSATAIQTVGAKKWDGFLLAIVGG